MNNVVKLGPSIPIPSSWLGGTCYRCGATDADEKLVDMLACAWFCASHHDDDMAELGERLSEAFDRASREFFGWSDA